MENNHNQEKIANAFSFVDALIPKVTSALTSIIGADDEYFGRLVGTGTLVRLGSKVYILTASHVVHECSKYPLQGYSVGGGQVKTIFSHCIHHADPKIDIAVIPIDQESLIGTSKAPLDILDFACNSTNLDDYLGIYGFPGVYSKYFALANGIVSKILPYVTVVGTSNQSKSSPVDCFAIEYPEEGQETQDGKHATIPDPRGLSGTLVWKANSAGIKFQDWQASEAKVVGLVHRWDTHHSSLVATRCELIIPFLRHVDSLDSTK